MKKTLMKAKSNKTLTILTTWNKSVTLTLRHLRKLPQLKETKEKIKRRLLLNKEFNPFQKIFSQRFWKRVFMKRPETRWSNRNLKLLMMMLRKLRKIILCRYLRNWVWRIRVNSTKKLLSMLRMKLWRIWRIDFSPELRLSNEDSKKSKRTSKLPICSLRGKVKL